jgi:hypothetical protein
VEEIDKPGEAMLPIIRGCGGSFFRDLRCRQIGPISWDQRAAAIGERHQQRCYAAAVRGAQCLQNAALEGMPLAQDCYWTWKVAEMGSMWWCSSTASIGRCCSRRYANMRTAHGRCSIWGDDKSCT